MIDQVVFQITLVSRYSQRAMDTTFNVTGSASHAAQRTNDIVIQNPTNGRQRNSSYRPTGFGRSDDLQKRLHVLQRAHGRPVCMSKVRRSMASTFSETKPKAGRAIRRNSGKDCLKCGESNHICRHEPTWPSEYPSTQLPEILKQWIVSDLVIVLLLRQVRKSEAVIYAGDKHAVTSPMQTHAGVRSQKWHTVYCFGTRAHFAFCRMLLSTDAISALSRSACVRDMMPAPEAELNLTEITKWHFTCTADQHKPVSPFVSET